MKMFGYNFFLDNTLSIKHLPPPKTHPTWRRLREDILRFVREREKLRDQEQLEGMVRVKAEQLTPYPGAFLMDDLDDKIAGACTTLADCYRSKGQESEAQEALKNIEIANKEVRTGENTFNHLLRFQELWEELMEISASTEIRQRMKGIFTSP